MRTSSSWRRTRAPRAPFAGDGCAVHVARQRLEAGAVPPLPARRALGGAYTDSVRQARHRRAGQARPKVTGTPDIRPVVTCRTHTLDRQRGYCHIVCGSLEPWRLAPRTREDLSARVIGGEVVVLDRDGGKVHQLNATASYVWGRCDGRLTEAEIADDLAEDVRSGTGAGDVRRGGSDRSVPGVRVSWNRRNKATRMKRGMR